MTKRKRKDNYNNKSLEQKLADAEFEHAAKKEKARKRRARKSNR